LASDLCNYDPSINQCTLFTNTQALNPSPVLTSFNVTASTALTVGEMCQFVDTNPNFAESTIIVSAPGTSGTQAVTAYLTLPHLNSTTMYCGGMVGNGLVFNADVHGGQMYGFHIYGSPTANTLLIGDRAIASHYGLGGGGRVAQPGVVTIYPAATVISNINPSTGKPDSAYAQITYPSGSFVSGDTVVNPGFAFNYTYYDKYAAYLDDPYNAASGFYYEMSGLGFNWTSALYTYSLGYNSPMGTPVDFMTFLGDDSVASGLSFTTQLTGSRTVGNLGGHNCFLCLTGWDHTSGAKTQQEIFYISEGYGASTLAFNDADASLNYSHNFSATGLLDTSLGSSTASLCTTTGGLLTNVGCSGGSGGGAALPFPGLVFATSATGGAVATSAQVSTALGATGLESILEGPPYNLNTSTCYRGILYSPSSGIFNCSDAVLFASEDPNGGLITTLGLGGDETEVDLNGAYLKMQDGSLPTVDILNGDANGGTIKLYNQNGPFGVTISLVGDSGNGYFFGGVTADEGIADTALGASTSPVCTTTGGLLTNSGCTGGVVSAATSGTMDGVTIGATTPAPATFSAVTSSSYIGPAVAPSGSCSTNGAWVFSQDGHATFCASGTWVTKI
jgi:hypothetical protein